MNTKSTLIFTYAHLPEKFMFLANPPQDITIDKYPVAVVLHISLLAARGAKTAVRLNFSPTLL